MTALPQSPATQPSVKMYAIQAAKLLGVACNPVIHKKCFQHHNDRPGVFGDFAGATGYSLHPVKGSLLCFVDCDDPKFAAELLSAIPRLADGYIQTRGDHVVYGVMGAYPLPNLSLDSSDGQEISSLRGPGLYQVGSGSTHYHETVKGSGKWVASGDTYQGNGKPAITLTTEETDILARLFAAKPKPVQIAARKPAGDVITHSSDSEHLLFHLPYISPSCGRKTWVAIGGICKDVLGNSEGFSVWDNWSSASPKYAENKPGELDRVWKSLQGKKVASLRKITALANEDSQKRAARDWFDAQRAKAAPARTDRADDIPLPDVTPTATAQSDAATVPTGNGWPADLPKGVGATISHFWKHSRKSVIALIRAVLTTYGTNEFTLRDLETASGIPYNVLWRAMKEYGADCLFVQICSLAGDSTPHSSIQCQTANLQPAAKYSYKLRDYADFCDQLLDKVIKHHMRDKYDVPTPTAERLAALGVTGDPDLPSEIDARLQAAYTSQEKQQNKAANANARREYERWRRVLQDMTVTPVSDADYTKAIVERAVTPALGTVQTWKDMKNSTGLPISTIRRIEQEKLGITRDPKYADHRLTVEPGQALPEANFDKDFKGFPARAVSSTGEIIPLRGIRGRTAAQVLLDNNETLAIEYITGTIPRPMTEDEKQQFELDRANRKRKTTIAKPTSEPKATPTGDQPHIGPGADPLKARRLLAYWEIVLHIKNDPETELSLHDRVYQVAGRKVNEVYTEPELAEVIQEQIPPRAAKPVTVTIDVQPRPTTPKPDRRPVFGQLSMDRRALANYEKRIGK